MILPHANQGLVHKRRWQFGVKTALKFANMRDRSVKNWKKALTSFMDAPLEKVKFWHILSTHIMSIITKYSNFLAVYLILIKHLTNFDPH